MKEITLSDFLRLRKQRELTVIDVRVPEQYNERHLTEAQNLPLEDLPNRLGEFQEDQTYYLICRSGNRSRLATEFLLEQGIQAVNVQSGMNEVPEDQL